MAFVLSVPLSRRQSAARATDRQSATADDVRVTRAHVEELGRETGHLGARISALEENKGEF